MAYDRALCSWLLKGFTHDQKRNASRTPRRNSSGRVSGTPEHDSQRPVQKIGVPASRINEIVKEERGITPETALRLERCFGGDAQSWMNLQTMYDLKIAEKAKAKTIMKEVEVMSNDERFAFGA